MENKNTEIRSQCFGICSGTSEIKPKRYRSVRFQTWVYFFLLTVIMLFLLWMVQILFLRSAYGRLKKQEVQKLGYDISHKYPGRAGNPEYDSLLQQIAANNDMVIVVFRTVDAEKTEDVKFSAEYVAGTVDKDFMVLDNPGIIMNWEVFYPHVRDNGKVSFSVKSKQSTFFVHGERLIAPKPIGGEKTEDGVYMYICSPMEMYDGTVDIMTNQMIIVTLLCLALSIVVSYFVSGHITKPLTEFSRTAEKLGKGDYSVRFEGNGYTEIDTLADTLNYATDEIGKTEQMRRDFLANVSHDLRTPLTMVKAYAEMIRDISGSDEVKRNKHSSVIIEEADRLTALVNDILNLSKLQSGTETIELGEVDMRALTVTVLERFDVYASRDGYIFDFVSSGDCTAVGDSRRLEQVIYNLVGNALNYTGENKTVRIAVERREDNVHVSVRDYGKGIAPEELDKVWERYYRANQHRRTVVGSGLGLSIVKSILSSHKARYGVSSEVGEGTEFWFELECATKEQPELLPEPPKKRKRRGGEK